MGNKSCAFHASSPFWRFWGILLCLVFAPVVFLLTLYMFCKRCVCLYWQQARLPKNSLLRRAFSLRGAGLTFLVSLRYRVQLKGLDKLYTNGPVLFLSNHPSLLDPFILYAHLDGIRPRFIADENQFTSGLMRWARDISGVITIPDYTAIGPKAREGLLKGMEDAAAALRAGDSVALCPAGFMQREFGEKLNNTSSVARILQGAPEARVIVAVVRGMWGSSFGRGAHNGKKPAFMAMLTHGVTVLLCNWVVFAPKRNLEIEFVDITEFCNEAGGGKLNTAAGRKAVTEKLEQLFNSNQPDKRTVPYYFWQQ
ncbi:1-acyl-sn-glycerol-3-phosphate acyltransferase [Desulfovibrio sp. OttesenSCG-928-F07]|nr:1-acyl-sn-glycerol-3-phosphate acyltransferase [Desulfovibrio sp. OttesenSCG-928-F07]